MAVKNVRRAQERQPATSHDTVSFDIFLGQLIFLKWLAFHIIAFFFFHKEPQDCFTFQEYVQGVFLCLSFWCCRIIYKLQMIVLLHGKTNMFQTLKQLNDIK